MTTALKSVPGPVFADIRSAISAVESCVGNRAPRRGVLEGISRTIRLLYMWRRGMPAGESHTHGIEHVLGFRSDPEIPKVSL